MKYIIIYLCAVLMVGCSEHHPVPPEAFTGCYENGGTPDYYSDSFTSFDCKIPKKP